ncbi:hypothetical protein [Clostridium sp. Cult2]|uniref:hypothetical protein n=1 Tax=Clostridium sp. Cult2 TaxID=2079003 RepID=UPI001F285546|nr:hypothetical protein [Clostridium sp. Cult2]MCF6466275.1 hypothetical protein [Clostridium sp. Cult2]
MSKILITQKNLDEYLEENSKEILIDSTMILSPIAQDLIKERGIKTIYKTAPKVIKLDTDVLIEKISSILYEEYSYTNKDDIRRIVKRVLEKIRWEG